MRAHLALLMPMTAFWALVFLALATGIAALWAAAAMVGAVTVLGFVVLHARRSRGSG
jgi:hypothetical protein